MKYRIFEVFRLLWKLLCSMFSKRVILFGEPIHPNLGDQAQLMCTEQLLAKNYPNYKLIKAGMLFQPCCDDIKRNLINTSLMKLLLLKMFVKKEDLFIGHSGYFFVDHHSGWFTYYTLMNHFKNQMIILPQTVNFYTPVIKQMASKAFSHKANLTIMCRDEVSYKNAQELFSGTKLLLYPDIVTSLIGTRQYNHARNGVLFCMRDDIEAHYNPKDIDDLMTRFANERTEKVDTTIKVGLGDMLKNRDRYINEIIEKISTYKVVITDRYHGTIFSAIASTPVVVIASADHKLSSGVNWFPKEVYGDAVQYATSLENAYEKALAILKQKDRTYNNSAYFKEGYWDRFEG